MIDHVEIGCTPNNEPCFPVNHPLARAECNVYLNYLRRLFPKAELKVRRNSHDFGTYYEVAAYFDDEDQEGAEIAYAVESNSPEFWDADSKAELDRLLVKEH